MGILAWIILGGLAGWISTIIIGADASYGIVGNILLGIIGAALGGLVFNFFGGSGITGFNIYSLAVAVVGSLLVIYLAQLIRGSQ